MGPFDFVKAAIGAGERGIYITNIYRTKISGLGNYIVRVETNKGFVGYGECRDLDDQAGQWLSALAPYVVGYESDTDGEYFQYDGACNGPFLQDLLYNQERMGTGAISGIEMACWDIVGKVYNVPVYKLLGPTYVIKSQCMPIPTAIVVNDVISRVEKGFKHFKCDMYLSSIAMSNYSTSSTTNNYGYREITINQTGLDQMHAIHGDVSEYSQRIR